MRDARRRNFLRRAGDFYGWLYGLRVAAEPMTFQQFRQALETRRDQLREGIRMLHESPMVPVESAATYQDYLRRWGTELAEIERQLAARQL